MGVVEDLVAFFGAKVLLDEEKAAFKKRMWGAFRIPLVKKDMSTHGALWSRYAFPDGVVELDEVGLDRAARGFVFVDGKGKAGCVFRACWGRFVEFLNEREDGLFPAVYFVDEGLSVCVGENGERGSMKPVFVYVGLGALV